MSTEYYSSRPIAKDEMLKHIASGALTFVDRSPSGLNKWCGLLCLPERDGRLWCWDLGPFVIFEVYSPQWGTREAVFQELARLFECAFLQQYYEEYFTVAGRQQHWPWTDEDLALWDQANEYLKADPRH